MLESAARTFLRFRKWSEIMVELDNNQLLTALITLMMVFGNIDELLIRLREDVWEFAENILKSKVQILQDLKSFKCHLPELNFFVLFKYFFLIQWFEIIYKIHP